ncbi:MAG: GtrA family protein [Pseudomonadota bacterium]
MTIALQRLISHAWSDERIRFVVVGAFNTLFGYATFSLFYLTLGQYVNYLILVTIAHFIAVGVAFMLYRRHVFRASGAVWGEFLCYNITVLGNLGAGLAIMAILVQYLRLHPIVAQGMVIVALTISNYLAHRYFTFRHSLLPRRQ